MLRLYKVNATGRIRESFGHLTSLRNLSIVSCNLSGSIPKPLWNLTNIELLNLGDNHLEGPISDFFRFGNLRVLSLRNNNFDDQLEFLSFNRSLTQLQFLDFSSNSLTGSIPSNVSGMQNVQSLRLSSNHLNGTIPSWIFSLPSLTDLNLSDNHFSGNIQEFKSQTFFSVSLKQNQLQGTDNLFAQIRVIDLSSNGFSGHLPVSLFTKFEFMKITSENSGTREYVGDTGFNYYTISLIVTTKGLELELPRVLTTEIIINLSRNKFEGHIPSIIGDLIGLRTLNLSHNRLEGKQFDTFENSSYQGNDELRGLPLSKDCGSDDGVPQGLGQGEEGDSSMISWQAVLMGYGCGLVIGLSIIYENEKAQEKILYICSR
ncbi:hypothetical protein MTR67_000501 [Solanum verrucosum]|uniref:Uncharacterized protein n=1 Tax=Solanum verrucosum TaxID=315347 RepID=A0AAF0T6L7_SOLVR|nr:hypothetical protein MTR67_000501 [Solanum verrucosum]